MSKWRQQIEKLTDAASFNPPASDDELEGISATLGVMIPDRLRELLAESNGVSGKYGVGLVWDCARISKDNKHFRTNPNFRSLYMDFRSLLFFGDAGNGGQFAFAIDGDGKINRNDIFVWDHETDSRKWVAPSLDKYLDWWLTGKLTI